MAPFQKDLSLAFGALQNLDPSGPNKLALSSDSQTLFVAEAATVLIFDGGKTSSLRLKNRVRIFYLFDLDLYCPQNCRRCDDAGRCLECRDEFILIQ